MRSGLDPCVTVQMTCQHVRISRRGEEGEHLVLAETRSSPALQWLNIAVSGNMWCCYGNHSHAFENVVTEKRSSWIFPNRSAQHQNRSHQRRSRVIQKYKRHFGTCRLLLNHVMALKMFHRLGRSSARNRWRLKLIRLQHIQDWLEEIGRSTQQLELVFTNTRGNWNTQ